MLVVLVLALGWVFAMIGDVELIAWSLLGVSFGLMPVLASGARE